MVALNVTVLTLVWFKPPPCPPGPPMGPPPPHGAVGGLPGELGMNADQAGKVQQLQDAHFAKMRAFYEQIVAIRKEAFADFGKPEADSAAAAATMAKIGAIQVAAEMERYQHFHDILRFCTAEQATRFQEILPHVLERKRQPEDGPRGPHGGPGHPPR